MQGIQPFQGADGTNPVDESHESELNFQGFEGFLDIDKTAAAFFRTRRTEKHGTAAKHPDQSRRIPADITESGIQSGVQMLVAPGMVPIQNHIEFQECLGLRVFRSLGNP